MDDLWVCCAMICCAMRLRCNNVLERYPGVPEGDDHRRIMAERSDPVLSSSCGIWGVCVQEVD